MNRTEKSNARRLMEMESSLDPILVLEATADSLFVAYPDSDRDNKCAYCGADAVFNAIRLPLSKIGHEPHCRWLEARAQVAVARRALAKHREMMNRQSCCGATYPNHDGLCNS